MSSEPHKRRRPTRRDLLVVVTRLQAFISGAMMQDLNENQDPANRRREIQGGMDLCVEALEQDPPVDVTRGEWARRFGEA